jgi:hypothetical protein
MRAAWHAALLVHLLSGSLCAVSAQESAERIPTPPLHERIDQLIESAAIGPLAPQCSDADFVRRIYLDLTGVIPTAEQARAFFGDTSPDKRQRLIDDLLASPEFVRHMTITFDVMLMERKQDKTVKQPEWEAFLYKSLAADKPLDQLFRELIQADGADEAMRPAARFVLDRDAEPNLVTRDIGRLVFGMDFQCCQCHDHPLIDDYYQDDYYGVFAFVHRTSLFTDPKSKLVVLTEKAEGEASFKSVFTGAANDRAVPRLPKGAVLFAEPSFAKGEEYLVKPDKTVRGVPKFSRRQALAELLSGSDAFSRNLANRLWAVIFGRGIVHPVDFHHAANPPANPRLLTLVSGELTEGGYQLRPFIRELVLTRAYQRACDEPRPDTINFADVAARLERLARDKESHQSKLLPLQEALARAKAELKAAREQDAKIAAELPKLQEAAALARQALEKAAAERTAAEQMVAQTRQQAETVAELTEKLGETLAKLPDDKVLAEAAAKIAVRHSELAANHQAAIKASEARADQHETAAKKLADAEASVAAATNSRLTPERFKTLERAQLNGEQNLAEAKYDASAIDQQVAIAKAIVEYAALVKADAVKAQAAWAALVERWTIAGQIAPLKPLSPEQLAASAMQATGALKPLIAAAEAKHKSSLQTVQTELLTQLRGTFGEFVRHYGGLPGQDFQATVNQALFFGNGGTIDGWLKASGENLVARLSKQESVAAVADEMYLSILSRSASEKERQEIAAFLKDRASDKPTAIAELAWALLSSSEFRFNH